MACDRRRCGYNGRNCHNHDLEDGIIELREGLRLLHECLRDMDCNRFRQAERECRLATREIEAGLCDVIDGARDCY